jgi:hypothetical protein
MAKRNRVARLSRSDCPPAGCFSLFFPKFTANRLSSAAEILDFAGSDA